jgi:hypothetical protein
MKCIGDLSFSDFLNELKIINPNKLRVVGNSCQMCCPFHSESNPSFSIFTGNDNKPYWTCFAGCGKGDLVDFVQKYYNLDFKEACKKLDVSLKESLEVSSRDNTDTKKSIVRLLADIKNYFEKFTHDKDNALYNTTISEEDIYYYEAPDIQVLRNKDSIPEKLKSYYICVFRGNQKKECRFFHYNNNDCFVPSARDDELPFIKFPYNLSEALISRKKILILEGEKDVETIKKYFPDFVGISFKHVLFPNQQKFSSFNHCEQFLKLILANRIDKTIYICPDNDEVGKKYMDNLCDISCVLVDQFIRIKLPFIDMMKKGADITDWVKFYIEKKQSTIEEIRSILGRCSSKINGWDYKRSRIWWRFNSCLDENDKKEKIKANIPVNCWENLYSFFEFNKCLVRLEVVTRKIVGNFGNLHGFIDSTDSEIGFNLDKVKNLLEQPQEDIERGQIFQGMKIKSEEELNKKLNSYVEECQFNDMLDQISFATIRPICDYEKINCGDYEIESRKKETIDKYNFGSYVFPPLFKMLVDNIKFLSQEEYCVKFQQLLIYKTLLACPYMLENDKGERCVRGDLRLVGENAIGKSTFCEELFGSFLNKKWCNSVPRIDVRDRDSRKVALFTPCLIIDEGTIYGTKAEIRAFYSEKVFKFMDKWKTSASQIPRRNIIISSSNSFQNSKDIESERRMWQIEIAYLPRLSAMSYDLFLVDKEDEEFWAKYGIFKEKNKNSFEFPVVEFWREMYAVYKYYESTKNIESVLDLSGDKLRFYKNIWMFDKYVESNEVKLLLSMFDWEDKDCIDISVAERKELFDSQNFSYEKNASIFCEAFETLKRKFGRKDVFNSTTESIKKVGSKRLLVYPKMKLSTWETYKDQLEKGNKSFREIETIAMRFKINNVANIDRFTKDALSQISQFKEKMKVVDYTHI